MTSGNESPAPGETAPDWGNRDSRWKVPLIIIGVLLFGVATFAGVFGLMRRSEAYSGAMIRIRTSERVQEALGSPITDGWFVTGKIQISGPSGRASLAIPVKGPKGRGTVYVEASKELGEWHFRRLIVAIEGTNRRIDLSEDSGLQGQGSSGSGAPDKEHASF
jgi:Cytochrome oxidase complex assembly protein 1